MTSVNNEAFNSIFLNGPLGTGIAAISDKIDCKRQYLTIVTSKRLVRWAGAVCLDQHKSDRFPAAVSKFVVALSVLIRSDLGAAMGFTLTPAQEGVVNQGTDEEKATHVSQLEEDQKEVDGFNAKGMSTMVAAVLSLIVATKISFFVTNHHVGQDTTSRPVAKMMDSLGQVLGEGSNSKPFKTILWATGHLFCTKTLLTAMGLKGIDGCTGNVQVVSSKVQFGSDQLIRLSSAPAGAAKICDFAAGLALIAQSPIRGAIEWKDEYMEIARRAAEIKANPCAYHVGALYLTGHERKSPKEIPDALVCGVNSVLRGLFRNHSLLDAQIFSTAAIAKDVQAYVVTLLKSLATLSDEQSKEAEEAIKQANQDRLKPNKWSQLNALSYTGPDTAV